MPLDYGKNPKKASPRLKGEKELPNQMNKKKKKKVTKGSATTKINQVSRSGY